ncbi:hypothetical protein YC2023_073650 [Brassica napus]
MRAEPLESPPGFPLLFLELSNQDRKMAMLYISHSDDTERLARIERVKQGIAETLENPSVRLPKITQNLDKGKGHVFDFSRDHVELPLNMERLDNETESASSSAPIHTFSAPALVTTGFHLGPSSEGRVHGNQSTVKSQRRRPPSWKRKTQAKQDKGASALSANPTAVYSQVMKRKSVCPLLSSENKTPKTSEPTVASVLKPLLPQ